MNGPLPVSISYKNQAEGENIRTLIEILAERLLRRHVLHGADEGAGLGHAVAFEGAGQAEIHHQDSAGADRCMMFCGFRSR